MPALAGSARMPYGKFLAFNALGGIAWGVTVVLLGYAAGTSYKTIESRFGTASAMVVLGLVLVALIVWGIRRRRAGGTVSPPGSPPGGAPQGR